MIPESGHGRDLPPPLLFPPPLPRLPLLPLETVQALVEPVIQRGADRTWSLADLAWDKARPEELSEADRSVVRFITYIEDHIPGYLTWLIRLMPVDGSDQPPETVAIHREFQRFFIAWAYDEERHASALTHYQTMTGMADPTELRLELAKEGAKHFDLPYPEPLEAFTYTMLQEKATQLFYLQFCDVVHEPLLRDLLRLLARDEARHFALYSQVVEKYLSIDPQAAVPHLKEVLRTFRMPLAETLPRYRRWSDEVAEHVGYDYRDAYEALERSVSMFVGKRGPGDLDDLLRLIETATSMP